MLYPSVSRTMPKFVQSKCDSAELKPQPQRSPTKNDFGGGSAAHQKIEADVLGYIAVTQIRYTRTSCSLTQTRTSKDSVRKETRGKNRGVRGETVLTTNLRKDFLVKFLGQDATPAQLQEELQQSEVRSATLQSRVVHGARATRNGTDFEKKVAKRSLLQPTRRNRSFNLRTTTWRNSGPTQRLADDWNERTK